MAPFQLGRNGIMVGSIDFFCLVCESHFRSEQDAYSHIDNPTHVKTLVQCPYIGKYPFDQIRDVRNGNGYFCEFCNFLLPDMDAVDEHVSDYRHSEAMGQRIDIERLGNNVLIFNKILVTGEAWNGIVGGDDDSNTCAVCDLQLNGGETTITAHVMSKTHILQLIQKKLEVFEVVVYRKVENNTFHCLVCNAKFPISSLAAHAKDKKHLENALWDGIKKPNTYVMRCMTLSSENAASSSTEGRTRDQDVDVDKPTNEYKASSSNDHQDETDVPKTASKGNPNEHNSAGTSEPCSKPQKDEVKSIDSAISTLLHEPREQHPKIQLMTVPTKEFITRKSRVFKENEGNKTDEVLINEKYCMTIWSYLMISKKKEGGVCLSCVVSFPTNPELNYHLGSARHVHAREMTPVVTGLKDEFVREVRPGLFHCGFCNEIVGDMVDLQRHLNTNETHVKTKNLANQRLEQYVMEVPLLRGGKWE